VGIGVALLFALAGSAAAQPVYSGGAGSTPLAPVQPGSVPPALFPPGTAPALFPTSGPATRPSVPPPPALSPPASPPPSNIQTLSFAEDHAPMREVPTGLSEIIPPPDKHHGNDEHETPEYLTPFAPNHGGWYTSGEYLLMRARNTDFDYAIRGSSVGLATAGPIDSLKYQLGSGLHTELGYRYGEGKWETAFAYTYFGDHGGATDVAGPGQVLFPTLTRPGLTDRALTANVHTNLDYQLFDMIVGRRMVVDDNFALRWLAGFRFTDIRQTFNANYNGADANQDAINTRSRFMGFGPIVGLEAVLGGWRGFHLYSRATAGLISGQSNNELLETNNLGSTTYVNTHYDVRKIVPNGNLSLGGGWQYRTLSIRAGYQISYWEGIFERPRFVDDVSPGKIITRPANLTLEGLFFQVGLSF
jgi:hypothetical protein